MQTLRITSGFLITIRQWMEPGQLVQINTHHSHFYRKVSSCLDFDNDQGIQERYIKFTRFCTLSSMFKQKIGAPTIGVRHGVSTEWKFFLQIQIIKSKKALQNNSNLQFLSEAVMAIEAMEETQTALVESQHLSRCFFLKKTFLFSYQQQESYQTDQMNHFQFYQH